MAPKKKTGRSAKEQLERKRLFKTALAYSGDTIESWARRHKLRTTYVRNVLYGAFESPRVLAVIDQTVSAFQHAVAADVCQGHPTPGTCK